MNLGWLSLLMTIRRIEGYDRLVVRWWWALPVIGAIVMLIVFWRVIVEIVVWIQIPKKSPHQLFKKLTRAHRLGAKEIKLLNLLTVRLPLGQNALSLFVDPSTWVWKSEDDQRTRESLEKLYAKIFGFPPDNDRS